MSAEAVTPTVTVFEPPGDPITNLNNYYGSGNSNADMIVASVDGIMLAIKSHNRYGGQPVMCPPTLEDNRYVFHAPTGQGEESDHWPTTKWTYDFVYDLSGVTPALYGLRTRIDFDPATTYPSASEWYTVERFGYTNENGGDGLEVKGGNSLSLGYCNIERSDGVSVQDGVIIHISGSENNPGFGGYSGGACTDSCSSVCLVDGTDYNVVNGFDATIEGARYEFEHEIFELANPGNVIVAVGMSVVTHDSVPECPNPSPTESPTTSAPTESPTTSAPTAEPHGKTPKTPKAGKGHRHARATKWE
jgi:hypothetical protein